MECRLVFLQWVGYFGIGLVGEKSSRMNLQVCQSFKYIQFFFEISNCYVVINLHVVIGLQHAKYKNDVKFIFFSVLGVWGDYLIISH